jgi:hypothetical protein
MTNKLTIPTIILAIGAVIYFVLLQIGCATCTPAKTRCADNVVQTCDSAGLWYNNVDCNEFGEPWACCEIDDFDELVHTCLPRGECTL